MYYNGINKTLQEYKALFVTAGIRVVKSIPISLNKRLFMTVKLTLIMSVMFCFQAFASTYAQKITLNEKDVSLPHLLKQIEEQSEYVFFFKKQDVAALGNIDVNIKNGELITVLDAIFEGQPCTY